MNRYILVFLLLFTGLIAKDLAPTYVYEAKGGVTDIVSEDGKIFVATDASCVNVYELKTKKMVQTITIPQIKDFMGDIIDAKVYNVDVFNGKILLTSQGAKGFREVHIYNKGKQSTPITIESKLFISKAKFIDENTIIFSLLGNEMYLFDLKTKKNIWKIDVKAKDAQFNSTFADFALNEDRTMAVVSDESGDLKLVDVKSGDVIEVLADKNLDKVFKVDIKNNKIITAGQDGRCVVYDLKAKTDYTLRKKKWFLIYGAGLSPSAKVGAYASDEQNNVTVFKVSTKSEKYLLTNNLMTLSSILFISEDEVFVTTDSNKFNYYKLK